MKQLGFEFMKEFNREVDIELCSELEDKLIEQMPVLLFQVNVGGKTEDDNLTTK